MHLLLIYRHHERTDMVPLCCLLVQRAHQQLEGCHARSMRTSHWVGSLVAQGAEASWGHPLALAGWGETFLEDQTQEEAGLCRELAPTQRVSSNDEWMTCICKYKSASFRLHVMMRSKCKQSGGSATMHFKQAALLDDPPSHT